MYVFAVFVDNTLLGEYDDFHTATSHARYGRELIREWGESQVPLPMVAWTHLMTPDLPEWILILRSVQAE